MSNDPHDMMLELFRSEVESHSDMLTSSLLALEQEPSASTLERMMRAAHSIAITARRPSRSSSQPSCARSASPSNR